MAKRLSAKKLEEMFKAYCERPSLQYVSRKCKVSHVTARKYRKSEDWEARMLKIQQKANDRVDDNIAKTLSNDIKIVQLAKSRAVHTLRETKQLDAKNIVGDLNTLIRLELFLRGENESRTEVVTGGLEEKSLEDLLAMKKQLEEAGK